jgi:hypothetical protein
LEPNPVLTNEELEELIDCVMHYGPFARRAVTHDIHGALYEVIDQALALGHHHPIRVLYEYRDQLHDFPHIREFMQEVWAEALPHPSTAEVEFDPDTETSEQADGTAVGRPLNHKEVAMRDNSRRIALSIVVFMLFTVICCLGFCGGWNGNIVFRWTWDLVGSAMSYMFADDPEVEVIRETEAVEPEGTTQVEVIVGGEIPDWQLPTGCNGRSPTCPWINGGSGASKEEVYAFPLRGDRDRFVDEADGCVLRERNAYGEAVFVVLEPCTAVENADRAIGCPSGSTCLAWTGPEGNLERIHRGCLQVPLEEPVTWTGSCPIISVRRPRQ